MHFDPIITLNMSYLLYFMFSYQSEDGSARSESGVPKYPSQPGVESFGGVASQGTYSYTSPDGST